MDLGLNIAAAGMVAEQVQVDQLSNDLANLQTPGYKPASTVQMSFGALLLSNTSTGSPVGAIDSGVAAARGATDLTQGTLHLTGRPLDFAIAGSGFFAVRTPAGVQYTRNGQFSTNAQGLLVDQSGNQVLAQNGAPIRVGATNTVPATALGVFAVANPVQLGNNNFSGVAAGAATGTVHGGELEASAVDETATYTQMQADVDAYTAAQQSIATIGQTLATSASTVGLVNP
ncbi:flagellar hook-basal body protein [Conexibacter sp. DBS9H8]|uniref:flagellar hook-basal body protein n=1 Tax=Conexibacter sp. DBS9H8 TaxID=2937801 RepID=UPI0020105CAB|nr:flagellar hook-basal body complex protein [Conexibacter sp. DBS9H8]